MEPELFDVVIIGSGPGGQKAAVQATKAGASALIIERAPVIGGACVHHGTIPSKALREATHRVSSYREFARMTGTQGPGEAVEILCLLSHLDQVIHAHVTTMQDQMDRNAVPIWHGWGRFQSPNVVSVQAPDGSMRYAQGKSIVIATGSHPINPPPLNVDHEHILDSDSILSLSYLPTSLTVVGSGVIACEYASIFAQLGVNVTVVDKYEKPMGFLDPALSEHWLKHFEEHNGVFLGNRSVVEATWDGIGTVRSQLHDGTFIYTEKMLVAQGRAANLRGLEIEKANLEISSRGLLEVDHACQTRTPGIYAVGDVIGPPALASASMEQGRRAVRHALGLSLSDGADVIPTGIYSIPELASVGLTEPAARAKYGEVVVGMAPFAELSRGQISENSEGLLKMVSNVEGTKVLGVHIVGEGAAELIHLGLMAMATDSDPELFIRTIFNFPTLAQAYRVAALEVMRKVSIHREKKEAESPAPALLSSP